MKHTIFGPLANFTFLSLLMFESALGFFRIPTGFIADVGGICFTGTVLPSPPAQLDATGVVGVDVVVVGVVRAVNAGLAADTA